MRKARHPALVRTWLIPAVIVSGLGTVPAAGEEPALTGVVAELHPERGIYPVGQPVWVDFLLRNNTGRAVTLTVPNVQAGRRESGPMGLPLEHIFSGPNFTALEIATSNSPHIGRLVSQSPVGRVEPIHIAPFGTVGTRVDLAQHYHVFRQPGTYHATWAPYDGKIRSKPVQIRIVAIKQAIIETDLGRITVRFFYEIAPNHVANFIELAKAGFYDGKIFHRVLPGMLIQGGCPRGDGTGVRPDGKKLKAEFSTIPHKLGTLSMARKRDDPDSASCQFFFCLTRIPEFDGKQTVFGEAIGEESLETLRRLGSVKVREGEFPISPPKVLRVTIVDAPATMPLSTSSSSEAQTDEVESPRLAGDQ